MKNALFVLFLTCLNYYVSSNEFMVHIQNIDKDNITISLTPEKNKNEDNTKEKIPFDYAFYVIGYYKYHKTPASWPDARDACNKEGGHIAVPDSKQELDLILKIFNMYPKSEGSASNSILLIGTTDILSPGQFRSIVTGQHLTGDYIKWNPGQPSRGEGEYCGCIARDGLFHDCNCRDILGFICEINV